jgi:hypothetical protein
MALPILQSQLLPNNLNNLINQSGYTSNLLVAQGFSSELAFCLSASANDSIPMHHNLSYLDTVRPKPRNI